MNGLALPRGTGVVIGEVPIPQLLRNYISGFQLSWISNTQLTVDSGQAQAGVNGWIDSPSLIPINLAIVGPSGLDTGILAAATPYALWALSGTSGVTIVASKSFAYAGVAPQVGYGAYGRRVGSFMSDPVVARVNYFHQSGSGAGRETDMTGSFPAYDNQVLNNGASTVPASVSCAAFLPPSAYSAYLLFEGSYSIGAGSGTVYWGNNAAGATLDSGVYASFFTTTDAGRSQSIVWQTLSPTQTFGYYWFSRPANDLLNAWFLGYRETL